MKLDKPVVACPNCGAPIRIISHNQLEYKECPFCGQNLDGYKDEVDGDLYDRRLCTFLVPFFEESKLITPQELADFFDCSSEQVRLLAQKGRINCVELSDEPSTNVHRRFLPVHVIEFLENEALVVSKE